MVHALKEIWRVLVPGGTLLDWRHLNTSYPMEVIARGQVRLAGLADNRLKDENTAADESLAQVVSEGRFICERQQLFDYAWNWDTLNEMKLQIEKPLELEWRPPANLSEDILTEAQRLIAEVGDDAKVRLRFRMFISQYRKRSPINADPWLGDPQGSRERGRTIGEATVPGTVSPGASAGPNIAAVSLTMNDEIEVNE